MNPDEELMRRRDGFKNGYVPSEPLQIAPDLPLHDELGTPPDPVTLEVIRSKLWNLNIDHGEAIRRASGSNIVIEGYDFNTSITTPRGDGVVLGPYALFFAGCGDLIVKWTLEHRSHNVGVRDGDVFIQDDPWVGSNHQMDTSVYGPVFWDGKIIAWLYNCIHLREIGGSQPGGFIQDAEDVYVEPTFMPPIKLVDRGELREDLVDAWTRRSRMPDLITLELKSQLAGFNFAKRRLLGVIERYRPEALLGAMRHMIDSTADAVGRRLQRLPDGIWRDHRYVAGARTGDDHTYPICLTFEKRDDRLRVSNEGTHPSVGAFNITPGQMRSVVLNGLMPVLAYDQYLCGAGLLQRLDFDLEPGTITSAAHPAAVSTSLGTLFALSQVHHLASKMVATDEQLGKRAFAASASHTSSYSGTFGTDQYGQPFVELPLDTAAGGTGGFTTRDGIDHGGPIYTTTSPVPDVEKYELVMPILYLYRCEISDSGGHGRWRGGATAAAALAGHRTDDAFIASGGMLKSVTQGLGLNGGHPATGGSLWYAADTPLPEWFRQSRIPGSPAELRELAPDGAVAASKKHDNRLTATDVFEVVPNPGGGNGDPILRDPELVRRDARLSRLREGDAAAIYGVMLTPSDQEVDGPATRALRDRMRSERLALARAPRRPIDAPRVDLDSSALVPMLDGVVARPGGDTVVLACRSCGQVLSPDGRHYRLGCCELERRLPELGPYFTDPLDQVDEDIVCRWYVCPGCGLLLDAEVCRPDDAPFEDLQYLARGDAADGGHDRQDTRADGALAFATAPGD